MPPEIVGYTLDAGALIQIERGDRRVQVCLDEAEVRSWTVAVPSAVLAQVWRGTDRQARLGRFFGTRTRRQGARGLSVEVIPLDERTARRTGLLCGLARHADVVDASVVICAKAHGHAVITSDPDDIRKLDPTLPLITV